LSSTALTLKFKRNILSWNGKKIFAKAESRAEKSKSAELELPKEFPERFLEERTR
jgi:hypothetical protein